MNKSQHSYQTLIEKIENLGQQQQQEYHDQIRCQKGCFSCCHPPDSLFQIEADTLEQAVATLDQEQKQRIQTRLSAYAADPSLLCPLLEEGQCVVYTDRPTICRTQGYALWFNTDTTSTLSWCPLNFTERQPQKQLAFDIERLNTMLSLITQLGWPQQPPRRNLVEIIASGLDIETPQTNSSTPER